MKEAAKQRRTNDEINAFGDVDDREGLDGAIDGNDNIALVGCGGAEVALEGDCVASVEAAEARVLTPEGHVEGTS